MIVLINVPGFLPLISLITIGAPFSLLSISIGETPGILNQVQETMFLLYVLLGRNIIQYNLRRILVNSFLFFQGT